MSCYLPTRPLCDVRSTTLRVPLAQVVLQSLSCYGALGAVRYRHSLCYQLLYSTVLHPCYAISGTDMGSASSSLRYRTGHYRYHPPICQRVCYAMSGTGLAYATTTTQYSGAAVPETVGIRRVSSSPAVVSYLPTRLLRDVQYEIAYDATRCPVLISRIMLRDIRLCCYGIEIGYAATRRIGPRNQSTSTPTVRPAISLRARYAISGTDIAV
eukprot:3163362-Rhodomonas_salina.2